MICQEYEDCARLFPDGFNAAQEVRTFLLGTRACQPYRLVFENTPMLGRLPLLDHVELRIVLQPSDEEHLGICPGREQAIVVLASVIDHNGIGCKGQLVCDVHIMDGAVGDHPETGQIPIVVEY